jgi:hypothetical protein
LNIYLFFSRFKKAYLLKNNLITGDHDLLAHYHSILNRWNNYSCQLLNGHWIIIGVRHAEIHTADTLVPESSFTDAGIAIEKAELLRY